MNHRTVVVHGASGVQGAPVARALLDRGVRVVGIARDTSRLPDGTVAARADLADADALAAAYRDADAVVVQLPLAFAPDLIEAHTRGIVAAVRRAEVGRVVLNTSSPVPHNELGVPFVDGRVRLVHALREAVAKATVVAPLFAYMENLAIPSSAERIRQRGELAYPVPDGFPMPWLALDDLAHAVADLLEDPAPPAQRALAGPAALPGPDAAAELAAALGRDVRWVSIDHVEYESMLAPHLGKASAAGIAAFYAPRPADAEPPSPPTDVVYGTTTLRHWASQHLA